MVAPHRDEDLLIPGRRPGIRRAFVAATLFFSVSPLVSLLARPPRPEALALLLVGWAIFGMVLVALFRVSPFARPCAGTWVAAAAVVLVAIAVVTEVAFGIGEGSALYFYAGVTFGRLGRERWALGGIAAAAVAAALATAYAAADPTAGITLGVTVGTISLTLHALAALGKANRDLQAARRDLAELAVAEERNRIARDLHDTLGHSLSVIALKSELAGRVLGDNPERARAEMSDVEHVAREALASVRETLSGYRQPSLAIELAGARAALAAAGIRGQVEPAPAGLPPDVDAVLGWAVREGVTNVLRHSEATTARIRVISAGERHVVEVEDDGRGAASAPEDAASTASRAGTGLIGLHERAERLGGSVEAGPLPDRGFRLRVALPARAVS